MERYRIKPGHALDLDKWDAGDQSEFKSGKKSAQAKTTALVKELDRLQELLYAEHKHKILIVLQGMDTAGKDGAIRQVFSGVNPQGVRVASFKVPTLEELAHDFLWRIHQQTPQAGEIVIFNRSHYEDVLVVRVHGLISKDACRRRYADINAFEQILTNEGTTILKFFLHIDKAEQKKRLEDRLAAKDKHWKFNIGDLKERKLWKDYMQAYGDAISATSTAWAPWYVIPANRKWYRNWLISKILVERLKDLKMAYPKSEPGLEKIAIED
jgi:PPK2 family polyphosphate:nucleotide phosphotransferase